jgi:hypothetical protein
MLANLDGAQALRKWIKELSPDALLQSRVIHNYLGLAPDPLFYPRLPERGHPACRVGRPAQPSSPNPPLQTPLPDLRNHPVLGAEDPQANAPRNGRGRCREPPLKKGCRCKPAPKGLEFIRRGGGQVAWVRGGSQAAAAVYKRPLWGPR